MGGDKVSAEVIEVLGDDGTRSANYCDGHNMLVIRVWQSV